MAEGGRGHARACDYRDMGFSVRMKVRVTLGKVLEKLYTRLGTWGVLWGIRKRRLCGRGVATGHDVKPRVIESVSG